MTKPVVDLIAEEFANSLSLETKMALYKDLKSKYTDEARDIMESESIEDALHQFTFMVAWRLQHRLLNHLMDDEELEQRVYS